MVKTLPAAKEKTNLRFNGSLWCNLDIALRNLDQVFGQVAQPLIQPHGLTVIEWYILRALYEQDGQHASELARAVGRAATSFTPNLDKLQDKDLIKRCADPSDRRAVRIFLTEEGKKHKRTVLSSAREIDARIASVFSESEFQAFQSILNTLQTLSFE